MYSTSCWHQICNKLLQLFASSQTMWCFSFWRKRSRTGSTRRSVNHVQMSSISNSIKLSTNRSQSHTKQWNEVCRQTQKNETGSTTKFCGNGQKSVFCQKDRKLVELHSHSGGYFPCADCCFLRLRCRLAVKCLKGILKPMNPHVANAANTHNIYFQHSIAKFVPLEWRCSQHWHRHCSCVCPTRM